MKGLFIVFEGMTGSGKKTHIKLLADRLQKFGKEVTIIAFPNFETDIARLTKKVAFDPYTLSLLYAADRSQYQERIKGLTDKGIVVISDRYCYSNFAYQSAHGIPMQWLIDIEKNIIKPSLVFLIDVPTSVSMGRVQQANIEDFTKIEILDRLKKENELVEKIRENYLQLASMDKESKWLVIDGSQDIIKSHERIWDIVSKELKIEE